VNDHIPIIVPDIEFNDIENDLRRILASGILTSGQYLVDFERAVADRVGVEHAVATTSATTALHLALTVVGVGPGDEVLLSDFTFPATANAVVQTGATPIFVDSGADDFAMDPGHARMLANERTRVIMPVDPFGQPADHLSLERIAAEVGALLVVDAACSLGASRSGRRCGAHGDMGCFSFHPRKVVTCGEGGMVTTDDPALAERLRLLRNHGARKTGGPAREFIESGFNYRLGEIPAALGLSQMRRIDQILIDRRTTAERYNEALTNLSGVWVPLETPNTTWSYQSFVLVLDDGIDRDNIITRMADKGIETAIGTYACHQHPAFSRWVHRPGDLPNSGRFADSTLTLPIVPRMAQAKVHRVVEALASILGSL
jgi:dTDP-4-amino-4,6-dideoxygalactose transaminase